MTIPTLAAPSITVITLAFVVLTGLWNHAHAGRQEQTLTIEEDSSSTPSASQPANSVSERFRKAVAARKKVLEQRRQARLAPMANDSSAAQVSPALGHGIIPPAERKQAMIPASAWDTFKTQFNQRCAKSYRTSYAYEGAYRRAKEISNHLLHKKTWTEDHIASVASGAMSIKEATRLQWSYEKKLPRQLERLKKLEPQAQSMISDFGATESGLEVVPVNGPRSVWNARSSKVQATNCATSVLDSMGIKGSGKNTCVLRSLYGPYWKPRAITKRQCTTHKNGYKLQFLSDVSPVDFKAKLLALVNMNYDLSTSISEQSGPINKNATTTSQLPSNVTGAGTQPTYSSVRQWREIPAGISSGSWQPKSEADHCNPEKGLSSFNCGQKGTTTIYAKKTGYDYSAFRANTIAVPTLGDLVNNICDLDLPPSLVGDPKSAIGWAGKTAGKATAIPCRAANVYRGVTELYQAHQHRRKIAKETNTTIGVVWVKKWGISIPIIGLKSKCQNLDCFE